MNIRIVAACAISVEESAYRDDNAADDNYAMREAERAWRDDIAAEDNWARRHQAATARVATRSTPRARSRSRRTRPAARRPAASSDGDPEPEPDGEPPSPFSASRSSPATAEGKEPTPTGDTAGGGDDVPTSVSREIPSHHSSFTRDLADRLQLVAQSIRGPRRVRVLSQAQRLRDCAERDAGGKRIHYRCHLPCCPSCQRQQAIRHNRKLSAFLDDSPSDLLRFVRLSVVADLNGVDGALRTIASALTKLRRRTVWTRSVAGGHAHVEPAAADAGSGQSWNVHAHLVLLLHDGANLDHRELAAVWTEILTSLWSGGSVDVVRRVRLGGGS